MENKSSLVMAYSLAPGTSGYLGLPPTAITILAPVIRDSTPFVFVVYTIIIKDEQQYKSL
jgi:hypothetical protein